MFCVIFTQILSQLITALITELQSAVLLSEDELLL